MKSGQTLQGSFSAVSKLIFAPKYSLELAGNLSPRSIQYTPFLSAVGLLFQQPRFAQPPAALRDLADPIAKLQIGKISRISRISNVLPSSAKFCNFLVGSFSAVSKRNFAIEYAFDSIFKTYKMCTLLHRSKRNIFQFFSKNRFKNLQLQLS